jgi:hypothetical protein
MRLRLERGPCPVEFTAATAYQYRAPDVVAVSL